MNSAVVIPAAQRSIKIQFLTIARCLAVALAFVIPLSNSLTTVVSVALLVFSLLALERDKFAAVLKHPVTLLIGAFMFLLIINSFHSIGNAKDISMALRKYTRLIYFPLLLLILQDAKWRLYAVLAFLSAVLISVAAAWYVGAVVFKDPIFTSLFVSFAVFTLAHYAVEYKKYRYLALIVATLGAYYLLFLSTGRTGQLLFLLLYVVFCWQRFKKLKYWLTAAALLLVVLGCSVFLPSSFMARQTVAALEVRDYIQQEELALSHESSMGMRLLFAHNSLELIKMKPILGWGTGSFRESYKQHAPEAQVREVVRTNPHNQYLLTWVELGLLGIICLLLLFATLAWQFVRTNSLENYLGFGFICAIAVGCTVNSWLLDFTSMFFFVLFASVFAASKVISISKPN